MTSLNNMTRHAVFITSLLVLFEFTKLCPWISMIKKKFRQATEWEKLSYNKMPDFLFTTTVIVVVNDFTKVALVVVTSIKQNKISKGHSLLKTDECQWVFSLRTEIRCPYNDFYLTTFKVFSSYENKEVYHFLRA